MSERILIVTDNIREIMFSSLLSFYSIDFINRDDLHSMKILSYDAAIVDFNDITTNINIGNAIRSINPSLSILIINDFTSPYNYLDFTKICGFGLLSILTWRKDYPEEIIDYIQALIHPGYPNNQSAIALVMPIYNGNAQFNNILSIIESAKILIEKSFNNMLIFLVDINNQSNVEDLILKLKNNNCLKNTDSNSKLSLNYRKADNYLDAIRSINSQIMILMDTDKQYNIDDIAKIINILKFGYYDMVIGSQYSDPNSTDVSKQNIKFIAKSLINSLLPEGIIYCENGLIGLNSTTSNYILSYLKQDTGAPIDIEVLYISKLLKFRVLQIPIKFVKKEAFTTANINSLSLIKSLRKLKNLNINKLKNI